MFLLRFDASHRGGEKGRMSTPARPDLRFQSLADLMADVNRLRSGPYDKAGQWDLGTMLDHLAKSLGAPFVEGRKNLPWPLGPVARFVIHRFARRTTYPSIELPVPKMIKPTPGADAEAAYAALVTAVEKLRAVPGPTIRCPPFGTLPLDDFMRIQLLHAAHHLSFLKPKSDG
jgi:hypothetical protein